MGKSADGTGSGKGAPAEEGRELEREGADPLGSTN